MSESTSKQAEEAGNGNAVSKDKAASKKTRSRKKKAKPTTKDVEPTSKAVASESTEAAPLATNESIPNEADTSNKNTVEPETMKQKNDDTPPVVTQVIQQPSKSSGRGLSVFALLLSLGALGGAGYTWYQMQVERVQDSQSLAIDVNDLNGKLTRLNESVSRVQNSQNKAVTPEQLSTRLLESSTTLDNKVRDLRDTQKDLVAAVSKVSADLQKGTNDLVIDEVSQLLRLANNNAVFAGDAKAAIKALTLADIQLKELASPRFAEVRRKINEEIALLDSFETVDVEGISGRLHSLAQKVPSLPLENEPPEDEFNLTSTLVDEVAQDESIWRKGFRDIWRDLVSEMSIRRIDKAPKPLLVPQQRYFLNQNLQLSINKAELALLQGHNDIYTRSIDDAVTWLNEYFDLNDENVKSLLTQLDGMRGATVSVTLPAVAGSYDLLQTLKGGQ